jgi:hypothetical protein
MGTLRFIVPILLIAGCTMEVVRDPGTTDGARGMFNTEVAPLLSSNCTICHYTGSNILPLTYDSIITNTDLNGGYYPESSTLLTKGFHEGPGWTATETAVIVEWLYAEGAARQSMQ